MIRVYFDQQIYSYLKPGGKFDSYLPKILEYKDRFLYLYSYAHILDFKSDKSEYRTSDLEFMAQIVEDHYLEQPFGAHEITPYPIQPHDCFNQYGFQEFSFDPNFIERLDISNLPTGKKEEAERSIKLLQELKLPLNFSQLTNINPKLKEPFRKLFPVQKDEYDYKEFLEMFASLPNKMKLDNSIHKRLREFISQLLKVQQNISDIDDHLKKVGFEKSFRELVIDSIKPPPGKKTGLFDYFFTAYCLLDSFGFKMDSGDKFKFNSLINDAQHFYYAGAADILIVNDKGFYEKAKLLYPYLGAKKIVLHFEEFYSQMDILCHTPGKEPLLGINGFLEGSTLKEIKSVDNPNLGSTKFAIFTLNKKFLNYFNQYSYSKPSGKKVIEFTKLPDSLLPYFYFEEVARIIDFINFDLGQDVTGLGSFDFEVEPAQIIEGKWPIRIWTFENEFSFCLSLSPENSSLLLTQIIN